jgi:hypothetical protein
MMRWIWAGIFLLFALASMTTMVLTIAKALGLVA